MDINDYRRRWTESGFGAKNQPSLAKAVMGNAFAHSFARKWGECIRTETVINWEQIELSDHVRKRKRGTQVQVADPDIILRLACIHKNRKSREAYVCYIKVCRY